MNKEKIINKIFSNENAYIELKVTECLKNDNNIKIKKELEEAYSLDSMLGIINNDYLPINVLLKKISIFRNLLSDTIYVENNDIDIIKNYYKKMLYHDEITKYKNLLLIHYFIIKTLIEKKEIKEHNKTSVILSNDLLLIKINYKTLEEIDNDLNIEILEKLKGKFLTEKYLDNFKLKLDTLEKELKISLKEDYIEIDEKDIIKKYIYLQYQTAIFFMNGYNLNIYYNSIFKELNLIKNVVDVNNLMIKIRLQLMYGYPDKELVKEYQKLQIFLYNYLIENPEQIEKYSIKNESINRNYYLMAIEARKWEIEKIINDKSDIKTVEEFAYYTFRKELYNLLLKNKTKEEILNSDFLLELLESIINDKRLLDCFYKKVNIDEVLDKELLNNIKKLNGIKFKNKVPLKNLLLLIAGLDKKYSFLENYYTYLNPNHENETYQLEGIEYINFKNRYTNFIRKNLEKENQVIISKDVKRINNYFNFNQNTSLMILEEGIEEITIKDNKYQMLDEGYRKIIIPNSIKKITVNDFRSINCFEFENYKEQGEEFIINFITLVYKVLEEKILIGYKEKIRIILKDDLEEKILDLPPYPVRIPGLFMENIININIGKKETLEEIGNIFKDDKVYKKR